MTLARSTFVWTALGTLGAIGLTVLTLAISPLPALIFAGLLLAIYLSSRPRAGFGLWLAGTAVIPIWAGVDSVTFIAPATAITVVLIPLIIRHGRWRVGWVDAGIVILVMVAIIGTTFATVSPSALSIVLLQWLPAFVVGRALAPAVGMDFVNRSFAAVFALVGLWSILEFLLDWHAFVDFAGFSAQRETWAPLQERGGVIRSEASFGHAIALGASLAASIPFTLAARVATGWKISALGLIAGGIVCTFSRGPLLAAALTLLLTLTFARGQLNGRIRGWLAALIVVGGIALVPALLDFFNNAGRELGDGTAYRERLFSSFITDLNLIGTANGVASGPSGTFYREFRSIDSALVGAGIAYGSIFLGILLLLLIVCAIAVLRGRGTPARISLLGQFPVLATVALITQYAEIAWFLAGIAAVAVTAPRRAVEHELLAVVRQRVRSSQGRAQVSADPTRGATHQIPVR